MKISINGKLVDKEKAVVSVFDHGLLYGDGVFEGIRCYDGLAFKLKEHIDRLFRSAEAIRLAIPMTKNTVIEEIIRTLKANRLRSGYIRLIVTRGVGDLGLDPRNCRKPTVIVIAHTIELYPKEYYQKGLEIVTATTKRNLTQALNPRVKSLNYLNNILAKMEAIQYGVIEAIMLTYDDYVAECTGDNIFIVHNGELITPPVEIGALEGITRDAVIGLAEKIDVPFYERMLRMDDLYRAQEVFLTGTAAEIVPVIKIDKRQIGDGRPGKITLRLMGEFQKITKVEGVRC